MGSQHSNAVLITGCSTGIGKATASFLARSGWNVYATARRISDLADLAAAGCRTLALDVTDEESMREAVRGVEADAGAVGVLINNAGYMQTGAIESVPLDRVRAQFETNVFGLVRLTQLVLPGMRRARYGRIVNLSSMGGRLTLPGGGYYHASKYGVEAISDALRFEVARFGIKVIVIEPGLIRTAFGAAATQSAATLPDTADNTYAAFNAAYVAAIEPAYTTGPFARLGAGPERVAQTIERAIRAKHPKARYLVTPSAHILVTLRRLLPDRAWDAFAGSQIEAPRPA
jgi:NAD(P)-dependent dehydrogenase (short-subunit alcohol dehydrogenase family)